MYLGDASQRADIFGILPRLHDEPVQDTTLFLQDTTLFLSAAVEFADTSMQ